LLGGVLLDAFPTQPLPVWGTVSLVAFIAAAGFQRWKRTSQATDTT
ncbi:MAG: MFS transporter, partial [Chloroflexi bacterium]|nr:MFS transporter [Chloroflexota bacterium]